jgi:hypothetical protein
LGTEEPDRVLVSLLGLLEVRCAPSGREPLLYVRLSGREFGHPRLEPGHRELLVEIKIQKPLLLAVQVGELSC